MGLLELVAMGFHTFMSKQVEMWKPDAYHTMLYYIICEARCEYLLQLLIIQGTFHI